MVASEKYLMDIEETTITPEELVDVIKSISMKNKEDILSSVSSVDTASVKSEEIKKVPSDLKESEEDPDDAPLSIESLKKELRAAPRARNAPPTVHSKIRRVPSTANPKHRTPLLYKSQRSMSSPHIHSSLPQRRQSLPQSLPNIHKASQNKNNQGALYQDLVRHQQNAKNQPTNQDNGNPKGQQQIVYIQVPNLPASQSYDSQALQQQISMQLQQLVPQIYSQLVTHGQPAVQNVQSNGSLNSNGRTSSTASLSSNSSGETVLIQNKSQQHQGSGIPDNQPHRKRKKPTNNSAQIEIINEKLSQSSKITPEALSASIQQQLQQQVNAMQNQLSGVDVQNSVPGMPQITIPLSQELLLQCQQLQDPGYAAYAPRLETIHEESLSVKKFKTTTSSISKSKIFACILTVLSVIVVVALAGDRTIAVVVVTVVFLIFFLGLVGFLYLNSAKNANEGLIS